MYPDIPKEFSSNLVIAHGFHKEITIQDFPVRGKKVFLHIKRRRWLNKQSKQVIQRDWNLVAQGTRMTVEFAAFLKVLSQYYSLRLSYHRWILRGKRKEATTPVQRLSKRF